MPSFSLILLMVFEKKIFEYFFRKFTLYVARATNQNKRFGQSNMKHGELLNKHSVKIIEISTVRQQKLPISTFPIISLCELNQRECLSN